MAVVISISEKILPNPVLVKLKSLDKIRAERTIAEYKKSLASGQQGFVKNSKSLK
jgi:hypothetical protein